MAQKRKNLHAAALSKLGAKKGGQARWEGVSAEQRREAARKAALARWEGVSAEQRREAARKAALARGGRPKRKS